MLSPHPTSLPDEVLLFLNGPIVSCSTKTSLAQWPPHAPVITSVVINHFPATTLGTASPVSVRWAEERNHVGFDGRLHGEISAWPLTSCVTLGKVVNLSVSWFSYPLREDKALIQPTCLTTACRASPDPPPSSLPVFPRLSHASFLVLH